MATRPLTTSFNPSAFSMWNAEWLCGGDYFSSGTYSSDLEYLPLQDGQFGIHSSDANNIIFTGFDRNEAGSTTVG